MKKLIIATIASGIWMNLSEFLRNELLFKDKWVSGFQALGLNFPSEPINGAIWGLWAFIMCAIVVMLVQKFSILKSTLIAWILGFVLSWIAMINLGVFPQGLLAIAIPWSFAEVYIAAMIGKKLIAK